MQTIPTQVRDPPLHPRARRARPPPPTRLRPPSPRRRVVRADPPRHPPRQPTQLPQRRPEMPRVRHPLTSRQHGQMLHAQVHGDHRSRPDRRPGDALDLDAEGHEPTPTITTDRRGQHPSRARLHPTSQLPGRLVSLQPTQPRQRHMVTIWFQADGAGGEPTRPHRPPPRLPPRKPHPPTLPHPRPRVGPVLQRRQRDSPDPRSTPPSNWPPTTAPPHPWRYSTPAATRAATTTPTASTHPPPGRTTARRHAATGSPSLTATAPAASPYVQLRVHVLPRLHRGAHRRLPQLRRRTGPPPAPHNRRGRHRGTHPGPDRPSTAPIPADTVQATSLIGTRLRTANGIAVTEEAITCRCSCPACRLSKRR